MRPAPTRYVVRKDGSVFIDEAFTVPVSDDENCLVLIHTSGVNKTPEEFEQAALFVARKDGFLEEPTE